MDQIIADVEALVAAYEAGSWWQVYALTVKLVGEVIAILPKGVHANVKASTHAGLKACMDSLKTEVLAKGATAINWGNLLAILLQILPLILPYLKPAA